MNKPLLTKRQCWQRFLLSLHVNGHMGVKVFNWLYFTKRGMIDRS